jgi:hypothetical protein
MIILNSENVVKYSTARVGKFSKLLEKAIAFFTFMMVAVDIVCKGSMEGIPLLKAEIEKIIKAIEPLKKSKDAKEMEHVAYLNKVLNLFTTTLKDRKENKIPANLGAILTTKEMIGVEFLKSNGYKLADELENAFDGFTFKRINVKDGAGKGCAYAYRVTKNA